MGPGMSRVLQRLEEAGLRARVVSTARLEDLRQGIEGWRSQGLLDESLYDENLAGFRFSPPESLPGARSLVVVANPQPQVQVTFHWQGRAHALLVPPTYVGRAPDRKVQQALDPALGKEGCRAVKTELPKKLLAARSGLGEYGRNNICYVPGYGSFHRLTVYYSDLPCQEDGWREPQMMARCRDCLACVRRCPTGAISVERFLVHAERCLTFHNERSAPFPAWIDPSWHHCLVGCLRCQQVCPENKPHLGWIENGPGFSEEETAAILQGTAAELPAGTRAKLEALDLAEYLGILSRNLAAALQLSEGRDG